MIEVHEMRYEKNGKERAEVQLLPYCSLFKDRYRKMYNDCYHEMREELDIKPYDFIRDDSFFGENMEDVYLLTEDDELIGSVALKDGEIDDLLVDKRYQGKGYGKKILIWAIENIKADTPVLHVAKWNKRAIDLYEKTGFKITRTFRAG
ncbi:MAG: GNAT family N-acetyltransferase [Clostridiales bacterium]|nr:GNAT family N-acetyltransferase [Clostridiales bacterium]